MDFRNYRTMDPNILYSFVNTRLRDFHTSLENFCYDNGLDPKAFEAFLAEYGFEYDKKLNQFR